jgi:hypothetical protein
MKFVEEGKREGAYGTQSGKEAPDGMCTPGLLAE